MKGSPYSLTPKYRKTNPFNTVPFQWEVRLRCGSLGCAQIAHEHQFACWLGRSNTACCVATQKQVSPTSAQRGPLCVFMVQFWRGSRHQPSRGRGRVFDLRWSLWICDFGGTPEAKSFGRGRSEPLGTGGVVFDLKCRSCGASSRQCLRRRSPL